MAQIEVTRDLLIEDAVFILQCLRQNQRGGRQNGLADVRLTLANSVTLDLSDYVAFLRRFGYVDVDTQRAALLVTPDGEKAAIGVEPARVALDVGQHFEKVISAGHVELDDVEGPSAIEALLRSAGIETTQPRGASPGELLALRAPTLDQVAGELGQGAVGRVRAARLGELGLPVAVKELKRLEQVLPWLAPDELSRRVLREAQAQAQLSHPFVLPVLDVRERAVVLPLAQGSVRTLLQREARLAPALAIRLAAQVAHALAHAHAEGVVHTAVKPENVLLDRRGNALLSDFGVARLVALPAREQAAEPSVRVVIDLGDAAYRAPEVSASQPAAAPADAYALGATLYEMLTGQAPVRRAPLPSLRRPECPRELDEVIDALLDDEAARRPALAAVARRLEALAPAPLFTL